MSPRPARWIQRVRTDRTVVSLREENGVETQQFWSWVWRARLVALSAAGCGVAGVSDAQETAGSVPQAEFSDTATLPPPDPHRLIVGGNFQSDVVRVVDGDAMELIGAFHSESGSNLVVDPNDRYYYLAETAFARGNRGTRADYVSVYDN